MFYYGTLYKDILIASSTGDYASINELICLANMENINAVLIDEGVPQGDRLVRLNQIAINQMRVLENDDNRNLLKWHEWIEHNIERDRNRGIGQQTKQANAPFLR